MPDILKLRGPRALSEFRLAKLLAVLKKVDPAVSSVTAGFWHFVETTRARTRVRSASTSQAQDLGGPEQLADPSFDLKALAARTTPPPPTAP